MKSPASSKKRTGHWFRVNRSGSAPCSARTANVARSPTLPTGGRSVEAYDRLRNSDKFKAAMAQFADMFTGPPTVLINEVLVEMKP